MGTSREIKGAPKGAGEMPAIGPGKTVKRGVAFKVGSDTPSAKVKSMKTEKEGE